MNSRKFGILSAILSSMCCVTPLLIVMLGISSIGLGTLFAKYHWFFSGISLMVLALSWYFYFKEKKKVLCACGTKEQSQNKNRLLKTRISLIIITIIVLFFTGLSLYTYLNLNRASSEKSGIEISNQVSSIIIPVNGMTCLSCEITVSYALKKLPGVIDAKASVKNGRVKVIYNPLKVSIKQMKEAISMAGYNIDILSPK